MLYLLTKFCHRTELHSSKWKLKVNLGITLGLPLTFLRKIKNVTVVGFVDNFLFFYNMNTTNLSIPLVRCFNLSDSITPPPHAPYKQKRNKSLIDKWNTISIRIKIQCRMTKNKKGASRVHLNTVVGRVFLYCYVKTDWSK